MKGSSGFVSSVSGLAGFIGFGLWWAFQCHVIWIGDRLNCGWVFIVMAPVGFLAGLVVGGLVFQLIKALVHGSAILAVKLTERTPSGQNSPDE